MAENVIFEPIGLSDLVVQNRGFICTPGRVAEVGRPRPPFRLLKGSVVNFFAGLLTLSYAIDYKKLRGETGHE